MTIKIFIQGLEENITQAVGYFVSVMCLTVYSMATIELVNGLLQTIVLITSICVGTATFIYQMLKINNERRNGKTPHHGAN
jgi:hypothetical protein